MDKENDFLTYAKVSSQYQITINKELKSELNVIAGDTLKFTKNSAGEIVLGNKSLKKNLHPWSRLVSEALFSEIFNKVPNYKNLVFLLEFDYDQNGFQILFDFIYLKRLSVELSDSSYRLLDISRKGNEDIYFEKKEELFSEIERFKDNKAISLYMHYLAKNPNRYSEEQFGSEYETYILTNIEKNVPFLTIIDTVHVNMAKSDLREKWGAEKIIHIKLHGNLEVTIDTGDEVAPEKYSLI